MSALSQHTPCLNQVLLSERSLEFRTRRRPASESNRRLGLNSGPHGVRAVVVLVTWPPLSVSKTNSLYGVQPQAFTCAKRGMRLVVTLRFENQQTNSAHSFFLRCCRRSFESVCNSSAILATPAHEPSPRHHRGKAT